MPPTMAPTGEEVFDAAPDVGDEVDAFEVAVVPLDSGVVVAEADEGVLVGEEVLPTAATSLTNVDHCCGIPDMSFERSVMYTAATPTDASCEIITLYDPFFGASDKMTDCFDAGADAEIIKSAVLKSE